MSPIVRYKAAAIVALVGAAAIAGSTDWPAIGLLLFGAVNVLLPASTAIWTRAVAGVVCFAALLEPGFVQRATIAIAPLLWLPALLLEWRLARYTSEAPSPSGAGRDAQFSTAAVIVAVAIGSLYYRWTVAQGLQQSAALFIGVPALLAIVVVFTVTPKSATAVACKAVTVGLLISLIFLWEGVVCVLMSAPLFYFVAVVVGKSMDTRRDDDQTTYSLRAALPVLLLIIMSLEGVHRATSFDRAESVTVTRIVAAPADAVSRVMFERPRFERTLPRLLQAGFPRPIATRHEHTDAGTRLVVAFRGGEMRLDGLEPRTGDLVLDLVESRPGFARWDATGDDSHMTHYLAWRGATVRWIPVSAGATRVEWTLHYRRSLDPAWYFGPMERFAVKLAADYLIDAVATP